MRSPWPARWRLLAATVPESGDGRGSTRSWRTGAFLACSRPQLDQTVAPNYLIFRRRDGLGAGQTGNAPWRTDAGTTLTRFSAGRACLNSQFGLADRTALFRMIELCRNSHFGLGAEIGVSKFSTPCTYWPLWFAVEFALPCLAPTFW